MKALTYHGSKDVRYETVKDPQLQNEEDIIIKVTATAICGSDLHIYRGKIPEMKTRYKSHRNALGFAGGFVKILGSMKS